MRTLYIAAPIGLAAGLVSGMFGVGGGVVVVPGLVLALGFSQHRASGTSMATIVAASTAALVVFARNGEVDWASAGLLSVGAACGAWLGARYLDRVPERALRRAFVAVIVLAAVRLALP